MKEKVLLSHKFVEFIPRELEANTIYVSISYATAIHNCCCGCGNRVVTPLSPADWKLIFDGRSISLEPSIGNWSFPCQSHYWIRNNNVIWAHQYSEDQIRAVREKDAQATMKYFGASKEDQVDVAPANTEDFTNKKAKASYIKWVKEWLSGKGS